MVSNTNQTRGGDTMDETTKNTVEAEKTDAFFEWLLDELLKGGADL